METERYLVVGAGPAGLCAARWLQEMGLGFDVVERQRDLGGIWNISAPGSPMYESCHFISSRTLSGFAGHPMPDDYPDYPRHDRVLAYLRGYAERYGLLRHVRFGTEVESAANTGPGWEVALAGGEGRRYAGLVTAVGNEWRPLWPEIPGTFSGETLHSSAYTSARQFAGRRVLVVGGGNSGCDIAVDAAQNAARAVLSLRRGYHFVPKHLFGRPTDVFAHGGPPLPAWLEQRVFGAMLRLLQGDLTRLGLPAPDHRLFETHPILNTQILERLAHGDLAVRPDVERFEGERVRFKDGSSEPFDLVVLATGYVRGVPFLGPAVLPDDDVRPLFLNLVHRTVPGLFVVGHFTTDAGAFPVLDLQCELMARLIVARRDAPARAAAFARRLADPPPDFSRGVRYQSTTRMANYVAAAPYTKYLRQVIAELRGAARG